MIKIRKQEALDYHQNGRPGKIEVVPTKPYSSQRDLSLAYSPGVAEPCLEIAANPEEAYKYTAKQNLVAVISNGTAVLGLGDIGALASKPVMEGKGLLFKIFADIDVFDIEVDAKDPEKFIETVKAIAPTFGGINLEDIKAPEAFEIERRLKEELDIPVMHDDQHGTAIISSAAFLNALELAGKKINEVKIVVNGAGASAVSCTKLYISLGAKKENIVMCDSKGVLNSKREDLSEHKAYFVNDTFGVDTLAEAIVDADMFLGLSKGDVLSQEMVRSMAKNPIVFALANPTPEIDYAKAMEARTDIIMATGRSDNPNQVNNVLGFPFIFRGALDVRATSINEEMKIAAVKAIAELAKETVPEEVNEAYGEKNIVFGRENIIPKPLDPRLITCVAPAVAKAAMDSGVAKFPITDWEKYKEELNARLGKDEKLLRNITRTARGKKQKIILPEGDNYKVLKAAQIISEEKIAEPILLGRTEKIKALMEEYAIELDNVQIIDPKDPINDETRFKLGTELFGSRQRKGLTEHEAQKLMRERNYFAAMMLKTGQGDAVLSGVTRKYADVLRPALTILGTEEGVSKMAGMYILITKQGPLFLADTTVNRHPTPEDLVDITLLVNNTIKKLKLKPNIALVSYSNFGSSTGPDASNMSKAIEILHEKHPEIVVDGEIQANFALDNELLKETFPFSKLVDNKVNTLIFPNLAAGNIAYKLLQQNASFDAVGPVLLGVKKSYHVLQMGSSVREIVDMARIAMLDARTKK